MIQLSRVRSASVESENGADLRNNCLKYSERYVDRLNSQTCQVEPAECLFLVRILERD